MCVLFCGRCQWKVEHQPSPCCRWQPTRACVSWCDCSCSGVAGHFRPAWLRCFETHTSLKWVSAASRMASGWLTTTACHFRALSICDTSLRGRGSNGRPHTPPALFPPPEVLYVCAYVCRHTVLSNGLSLKSLAADLLNVSLDKSLKLRCSDWEADRLTLEQVLLFLYITFINDHFSATDYSVLAKLKFELLFILYILKYVIIRTLKHAKNFKCF